MTYQSDFTVPSELLEQIATQGFDVIPELIRIVLNTAMQAERQQHLRAAPYQHSPERRGHANGYKPKTMMTRLGDITFDIPQVREGGFYPQALEKGLRSERALHLTLAEMYVQGVSTRKVSAIIEQLCGSSVSSTMVSQAAAQLDETLEVWLTFLQSLVSRGMSGIRLIVSDEHSGLKAARRAVFGGLPWQRCQFHLQQNGGAHVPRQSMKAEVDVDIRKIFNAPNQPTA
jgi:transposase-like protein